MKFLVTFLICFIVVFLFYLLFVILNKKTLNKLKNSLESKFLIRFSKINIENINSKTLAISIALSNSFIMSLVFSILVIFVKNTFLRMIIGFFILIPIILIVYYIVGKILKQKEGK